MTKAHERTFKLTLLQGIDGSKGPEATALDLSTGLDEDSSSTAQATLDSDSTQPGTTAVDDAAQSNDANRFAFPTESQEASESNLLPQMRAASSATQDDVETRRPLPTELTTPTTPKASRRISYGSTQPDPLVGSYVAVVPEMIPLPDSDPESPYGDEEFETPKRLDIQTSQISTPRSPSSTAVPIRFRRPPESPGINRELPTQSPVIPDAGSPFVATRRGSRPNSTEFKTSNEFRPLYLVERNRKIPELESSLPSLPSSRTSSRAPSVQDTEDGYESAEESLARSWSPTGSQVVSEQVIESPFYADDNMDSQQTTPRASAFPSDVLRSPSRSIDWSDAQFDDDRTLERGGFEQATPQEHPLSVQETLNDNKPTHESQRSVEFSSPLPLLPAAEAETEQVHGTERSMELDSPLPLLPKDKEASEPQHEAHESMELDSPLPLLPKDDMVTEGSHTTEGALEPTSPKGAEPSNALQEADRSVEHDSPLPLLPKEGEEAEMSHEADHVAELDAPLPLLPKDEEETDQSREVQDAGVDSPLPLLPKQDNISEPITNDFTEAEREIDLDQATSSSTLR